MLGVVDERFVPGREACPRSIECSTDPSRSEALSLLDAHIAALEAIATSASVSSSVPSPMTPALPLSGLVGDTALTDENSGMLDSTIPHA